MGAAASVGVMQLLPDELTAAQAKNVCGVQFDSVLFDKYKSAEGYISKNRLISLIDEFMNEGLKNKFSALSPFDRNIWEPFVKSFYYRNIIESALPEYIAGDSERRRQLLLQSLSSLPQAALQCDCCGIPFSAGVLCNRERTAKHSRHRSSHKVWEQFEIGDPDDIATHLWTYSMGGIDSFYRKVNAALLNEDAETLNQLRYIICGVLCWINEHIPANTSEITLYRGTPITEQQEHKIGTALNPRFSLAEFIDPADVDAIAAAKEASLRAYDRAKNICRMPMFLATSESIKKAQEFTWVRKNGISCPILEFKLPPNCDGVGFVEPLSHFPEEREYLLSAYTPVQFHSQRLEYLEIGHTNPKIKLVMIVTYLILSSARTFQEFEAYNCP